GMPRLGAGSSRRSRVARPPSAFGCKVSVHGAPAYMHFGRDRIASLSGWGWVVRSSGRATRLRRLGPAPKRDRSTLREIFELPVCAPSYALSCAPDTASCDGNVWTECETDLLTSQTDCGVCGNDCGAETCTNGRCTSQAACTYPEDCSTPGCEALCPVSFEDR